LDKVTLFEEQAAYCAYLLRRALDPRRRALIERERQDWLMLAYQDRLWSEIEPPSAPEAPREHPSFLRRSAGALGEAP
jgi:hypothetical protein